MTAFADVDLLVRHLTGDPAELAARATAYLYGHDQLLLTDLVFAETVSVLESFYEAPRASIAHAMRSLLAFERIQCVDAPLLLRAVEIYESSRTDFTRAYLVACAESTGVGRIVSFDQSIDGVRTVDRIEPP
jgi:predicted nucleic acid-binding protein